MESSKHYLLRLPLQVTSKYKDVFEIFTDSIWIRSHHNVGGIHTVVHKEISHTTEAFDMGVPD